MKINSKADRTDVRYTISILTDRCHKNASDHEFYVGEFNLGEKLMLIVTELAEWMESDRKGTANNPDEHCPEFTNEEIECADICIRVFDLAEKRQIRLGKAILTKMDYNHSRPYKHGKKY